MTAPLFFADAEKLRSAGVGDVVLLDGPEGRHAASVRRLTVGEKLELADGEGLVCSAEVAAVVGSAIQARIVSSRQLPALRPRLTVVQALAKGDRDERAIETMTEVGVDEIVPWQASRCIVRWDAARAAKGTAKWRATAREAAKQARRPWIPEIADLQTTQRIVQRLGGRVSSSGREVGDVVVLVLHESATEPIGGVSLGDVDEVVVVVGPEGGITDDELAAFAAAGAKTVRLGPTVLRTSTAGTVAAAVVFAGSGRWKS